MIFLDITSEGTIFIYGLAGIIYLLLLGITISTAIRVNKRDRHSKIVIQLLAKIAEKHGVESEIIDELVNKSNL